MCVVTLPRHLVKKSTILNRYFLCFIYRKPCTLNSLLISMADLRMHRWWTFHSTPEEFTSSVFKWMKSTKETAFPAGKEKKNHEHNTMRTSCIVEYNYNCQEPLVMFIGFECLLYNITSKKPRDWLCQSNNEGKHVSWHVQVEKYACIYGNKSNLKLEEGRTGRSLVCQVIKPGGLVGHSY